MWEGWRRKNDTEIYSSSSAQTQCTLLHAILGYTIENLSYQLVKRKKKRINSHSELPALLKDP